MCTQTPRRHADDEEVDPPRRLVQTFSAQNDDLKGEGTSRVTWDIEPTGDSWCLRPPYDLMDSLGGSRRQNRHLPL
jgi:hypothetical protein